MEEVKSITPIKSIKEVKNIYELTDSEAADLREMIKNYKEGVEDSRRRRRRRRRYRGETIGADDYIVSGNGW